MTTSKIWTSSPPWENTPYGVNVETDDELTVLTRRVLIKLHHSFDQDSITGPYVVGRVRVVYNSNREVVGQLVSFGFSSARTQKEWAALKVRWMAIPIE